jgi:hypothetical protein
MSALLPPAPKWRPKPSCADDGADVNADARNVLSSRTVLPFSSPGDLDTGHGIFGWVLSSAPRRDAGRIARALVAGRITE